MQKHLFMTPTQASENLSIKYQRIDLAMVIVLTISTLTVYGQERPFIRI
ncbi:MAG: hypothetical protein ACI86M_002478 [Saprospiraceae bacterium]|jgi:hypothetical protein